MRPPKKLNTGLALVGAVLVVTLASCNNGKGSHADNRGEGDVPIGSRDYGKPHIVNNADDYPNVSIKCDGKWGLLIIAPRHWKNDVPVTIASDPRCPGYNSKTKVAAPTGGTTPQEDDGN